LASAENAWQHIILSEALHRKVQGEAKDLLLENLRRR
jgi:hypothetical protein